MNKKKISELKDKYNQTPIPSELESVVSEAIKKGRWMNMKKKTLTRIAGIAAGVVIFVGGINISPGMANVLADVPGMKNLVQVLTFKEYNYDDGLRQANIKVPGIQGLEESGLGPALNEKYLEENKKLYEQFMAEVEEMEKFGDGHLGVHSGYEVKTDNDRILSIGRYVLNIAGSSSTVFHYDTIDKVEQILITLPSLFKDESYVEVISQYLKDEMLRRMKDDPYLIYWVEGSDVEFSFEPFTQIDKNQSFYINDEYKLVISFDKYEIGPGYMGIQEFVIPTEVIEDLLVSNEYIN